VRYRCAFHPAETNEILNFLGQAQDLVCHYTFEVVERAVERHLCAVPAGRSWEWDSLISTRSLFITRTSSGDLQGTVNSFIDDEDASLSYDTIDIVVDTIFKFGPHSDSSWQTGFGGRF
jgi:hypothetical protein